MTHTSTRTPILSAKDLCAGYGPIQVLKGLSFDLFEGEVVTIIGANGAGKSTLLRCLSRLHPITSGSIELRTAAPQARQVHELRAHELAHLGVAHVPEGRQIFQRLSVTENLELGAYSRPGHVASPAVVQRVFELFPVLRSRAEQLGGTLSGGEQQMLAIARALMSEPQVLLMDEPSMGVAPLLVTKIFETITELNAAGMTILLVEQNAHLALGVANRGYVLETGTFVLASDAETLRTDPRVKQAYLGE